MKNVLIQKFVTDDTQGDYTATLPIPEILRMAEIVAFNHADALGLNHENMQKTSNAFWIVSKMKVFLRGKINSAEKLKIKTWTHVPGLVRFDRDIVIKAGNSVKAKISSEWCCLDTRTHQLRRASSVFFPELEMAETAQVNNNYTNLKLPVSAKDFVYTKTIRQSDVDINNHTNNLKYNVIALDAFSTEELKQLNITEYEIYFVNESHEGDKIDVYRTQQRGYYYVEGKVADKTIFRVVFKAKKISTH